MNWTEGIVWYVAFVVSATFHEAAHALLAMLGGDRTAYYGGQVTLNPLPHMQREPFGMILLPVVSLYVSMQRGAPFCFGYASTPINPLWAWRNPRKAALMSLAGPAANLLLAALAFGVLWFAGAPHAGAVDSIRQIAGTFLFLNLLLFVFNLIPLPPLDGVGVLGGFVPPLRSFYDGLARLPYIGIVTFIVANELIPSVFLPLYRTVNRLLPYPYH